MPEKINQGPIADDPTAAIEDDALGIGEEGGALFLSVLPTPLPQTTLNSLAKKGVSYLGAAAFDDAGGMWLLCAHIQRPLLWIGLKTEFVLYEEIDKPKPGELPPGPLQHGSTIRHYQGP